MFLIVCCLCFWVVVVVSMVSSFSDWLFDVKVWFRISRMLLVSSIVIYICWFMVLL